MRAGDAFADQRQKQMREQEAGEVVHGEAQFVAVGAGLPRPLRPAAADAGIVDEKIEPWRRLLHRTGQAPHLGKGGKVRRQKVCGAAGVLDLGDDALAAPAIAAMHQNPPALFAQPLRHHAADAVRRTGDQRRFSVRFCHGRASVRYA